MIPEPLNLEREEQAALMSAISDAILAVDLGGNPLFYNSRFILQFGRRRIEGGKSTLANMFEVPEISALFQGALEDGKTGSVKGIAFEPIPGKKSFFSVSVSPLRKAGGGLYGAVGIFHDVTELKLAEQMRIDFVANVSHELRTPLTAIKGYADTLLLDINSGGTASKEFLEIIVRNSERLMALINDLLDLSSLEAKEENSDVLHKVKINTQEFTKHIVEQMQSSLDAKNHVVEIEASAVWVWADSRRLEQVLVNLLDNAHKYTPPNGKLKVVWENVEDQEVLLKVIDTGPGIPPEHHTRLFERFYRIDKARSRELGGTGLGLAIVKHIMQRHGGSVVVESAQGQGSSFICRFPNT